MFKKTEKEKFIKTLNDFREKNIPKRYNQVELLDHLCNEDIDHYISISNRSDGKSFNYIYTLIHISIELGIKFILLCRHYTVRVGYQVLIDKIFDKTNKYDRKEFFYSRSDFFTTVHYKENPVCLITDLNQATDLKFFSNFLEDFPIIVYDEFLALEYDYLPDEWDKLKTIYSSVDRKKDKSIPYIKIPKILYIGNSINFSSPILSELDIFNILEKHPMNTIKQYGNIILEMRKNENANEDRNLRAFREKEDSMTYAQFKINHHQIATDNERERIKKKQLICIIKLDTKYLQIKYNEDLSIIILSIISHCKNYDFNINLHDNTPESIYLSERFYSERMERKYNLGKYLFDNNYSKDYILSSNTTYSKIDIDKIIGLHYSKENNLSNFEKREIRYKDNYIERTKKSLFNRFL